MKPFLKLLSRLGIYLAGLVIIALGINLSKLSGLGISPVSSIPGVLSAIWPQFSLGSMVIIVYCVLVLAQFIVLRSKFKPIQILGVPIAIIFGWIVDFVGIASFKLTIGGIDLGIPVTFQGLLSFIPKPENYFLQLLFLIVSILVIGVGVFIYLRPKLVPMPAEGLAAAISGVSGKPFGNCKTAVDVSMITIALLLQFIFLGAFQSFLPGKAVVREGTLLAAVFVGQVVKLLAKWWGKLHAEKKE